MGIVLGINWVRGDQDFDFPLPTGPAPVVGQPAPDFAIPLVDTATGETVTFRPSEQKGKVIWLNIWASWCAPCRAEMPDIQKVWEEFQGQGVMLVAIAYNEPYDDSTGYMERNKFTVPVGLDPGAKVVTEYRLTGLPPHFFIDKEGVMQEIRPGSLTREGMRERLQKLLNS